MLTFDSYNQLIHMFSGPLGLNMNVGGDYEFIIMSATPDKVILQGKNIKYNGNDAYAQRHTMAYPA